MENASKALIIAGAILLAILIISLGIIIYRQAAGVIDVNALDEVEVTQFNAKFDKYFGTNVRGANVNALINAVKSNNNTQDDISRKVKLDIKTTASNDSITLGNAHTNSESDVIAGTGDDVNAATAYGTLPTGATYVVGVSSYSTSGLISTIEIHPRE